MGSLITTNFTPPIMKSLFIPFHICLVRSVQRLPIRTRTIALFFARLIAYRRPDLDLIAADGHAALRAQNHAQAALLQNVDVVIVGVTHSPAGHVLLHVLMVGRIDAATVAIRPVGKLVQLVGVGDTRHNRIVDIPFGGCHDFSSDDDG